jgi:hypothetical protein
MINTAAGTEKNVLVIIIEFQSCFPRICGFVTTDHEVILWMIVVVKVFAGIL